MTTTTPGYDYDDAPASAVTADDLDKLRATVLFGPDDEAALRDAGQILGPKVEEVLDVWYGFVGDNPHLLEQWTDPQGRPIDAYLSAVRARFGQWIRDTCEKPYDDRWLAYQEEIGLRHTPDKKNKTDGVTSTSHVPLRYLIALIYPITATVQPFLESGGAPPERVAAMMEAWRKSVIMQIALWSRPYTPDLW